MPTNKIAKRKTPLLLAIENSSAVKAGAMAVLLLDKGKADPCLSVTLGCHLYSWQRGMPRKVPAWAKVVSILREHVEDNRARNEPAGAEGEQASRVEEHPTTSPSREPLANS